jgi:hypothetical protein
MKKNRFVLFLFVLILLTSCSKDQLPNPSLSGSINSDRGGGGSGGGASNVIGGIEMGDLVGNLFVFTNGSAGANWQGATKGYVGNVAINGNTASFLTSGLVNYAGTVYTNGGSLGAWQSIVDANAGQATAMTYSLNGMQGSLENAFSQINALPATPGFTSVSAQSLNGLNTQNNIIETYVINITSGFNINTKINITGDAGDVFILRWDTDANPANGYNGQVKIQSGGAIVPLGGLTPDKIINVAGDLNSSGGGSNPAPPYPQGPRYNNGTGALITGGQDFSGGGFFTGYWLTTGAPTIFTPGEQPYGVTTALNNAIFVGGWYSKTTQFTMTGGTSGVYIQPVWVY